MYRYSFTRIYTSLKRSKVLRSFLSKNVEYFNPRLWGGTHSGWGMSIFFMTVNGNTQRFKWNDEWHRPTSYETKLQFQKNPWTWSVARFLNFKSLVMNNFYSNIQPEHTVVLEFLLLTWNSTSAIVTRYKIPIHLT